MEAPLQLPAPAFFDASAHDPTTARIRSYTQSYLGRKASSASVAHPYDAVLLSDLAVEYTDMQSPSSTGMGMSSALGQQVMASFGSPNQEWAASSAPSARYDPSVFRVQTTATFAPVAVDSLHDFPSACYDLGSLEIAAAASAASASSQQPTRRPKRRRMYTDATRARHREVQRQFIQRKKLKMQQDKLLATELDAQIQVLQARKETHDLRQERAALVQDCLMQGVGIASEVMVAFLQDEADVIARAFTPLNSQDVHHLQLESLEFIEMRQCGAGWTREDARAMGMEWTMDTRLQGELCEFSMLKHMDGDCKELFGSLWTLWAESSVQRSALAGPSTLTTRTLLQTIDADACVLYNTSYDHHQHSITRSLELVLRIPRGDETMLLVRRLEHHGMEHLIGPAEHWKRHLMWFQIASPSADASPAQVAMQWHGCIALEDAAASVSHRLLYRAVRLQSALAASPFAVRAISEQVVKDEQKPQAQHSG